jgi:hypothetical protein
MLRINPNNATAKNKLDELISSEPLFASPTPLPVIPTRLVQPTDKIGKRGLPTWEKILLPVLSVIAAVAVCIVVLMISGPLVNSVFEKINANLLGTSTSNPQPAQSNHPVVPTQTATLTILPIGSDLVYKNYSIHIDRIETTQSIGDIGTGTLPNNGRFVILYLSITNTGDTQEAFLPILETVIFDADVGIYHPDTALSFIESSSQGIEPQQQIDPHQTVPMVVVYDISSSSRLFMLGIVMENMGVLLDIPNGITSPNATTTPLPIETLLSTETPLSPGSSFVIQNNYGEQWQIRVTRIETADSLKASYGNDIVKAAGRFAIIFLEVTNRGLSPGTFVAIGFLNIQDASGQEFENNFMATMYAQDLYQIGYCAAINPEATESCVIVYDISKQSDYYLFVPSILADPLNPKQLLTIP